MAGETIITVVGNLTADPELRWAASGTPVANFTVASTPRTFNRQSNEWEDGETLFVRCSIWREAAENVAESLQKGMRVVAQGRLKARSYQDREGNNRTAWELEADEVGPSLRYATAKVERRATGGQQGGQQQGGQQGGGYGFGAPPQQGGQFGAPPQQGGGQPPAYNGPQQGGPQQGGPQQGGQQPQQGDPWNPGAQGGQQQGGGWAPPGNGEPAF